VLVDHFPGNVGEARRQFGRSLIASFLREQGVATDVGDQKRPDVDVVRAVGLAWERPIFVSHRAVCARAEKQFQLPANAERSVRALGGLGVL